MTLTSNSKIIREAKTFNTGMSLHGHHSDHVIKKCMYIHINTCPLLGATSIQFVFSGIQTWGADSLALRAKSGVSPPAKTFNLVRLFCNAFIY